MRVAWVYPLNGLYRSWPFIQNFMFLRFAKCLLVIEHQGVPGISHVKFVHNLCNSCNNKSKNYANYVRLFYITNKRFNKHILFLHCTKQS